MRTLDQILTKKDYSRKTPASLFYKDSPLWQRLLTIGCVVFLSVAGLGEWKVLNGMLGGLPKAITLGVIGLACFTRTKSASERSGSPPCCICP